MFYNTYSYYEYRENGRDLAQSCGKTYTNSKFKQAKWQHQNATKLFD